MDPVTADDQNEIVARPMNFLDCGLGHRADDRTSRQVVVVTLGTGDGSVEQLALEVRDATRMLSALAFALRPDRSAPRTPYGTNAWVARRSVLRAEAAIQHEEDVERAMESAKHQLPDVAEFVCEQLTALRKLLARTGRSRANPDTVVRRVRHAMLVLVEAMREDR